MRRLLILLLLFPALAWGADIVTHHDTIPDPCPTATRTSSQNGDWNSTATWGGQAVPTSSDDVYIGHTVTLNVSNGVADCVQVNSGGTLIYQTTGTTQLTVKDLLVRSGGTLTIGTSVAPITGTAKLIFRDAAPGDTNEFWTGLIAAGTAVVRMHGTTKTPFRRLAAAPSATDTELTLASTVTGWAAGDLLFLPDSRHLSTGQQGSYSAQWEYPTVDTVVSTALTVQSGLSFAHPGSQVYADAVAFFPHIANLDRNVVIRSANPSGTRGHILFTQRPDVDIRYVEIEEMGRTLNTGASQIGRYPLHLHHLVGPETPQANGYQFSLVGNAIHSEAADSTRRWGIAVHDSHYGLVQDNVVVNVAGAAYVTESGGETGNVFDGNFGCRVYGDGTRQDQIGKAGNVFWFRGPSNHVTNNVACNSRGGQNTYGYSYEFEFVGTELVPNVQGDDPNVAGEGTSTNMHMLPVLSFVDNEVYGAMWSGLTFWWLGSEWETPKAIGNSMFDGLTAWNFSLRGIFAYHSDWVTIDNYVARGSSAITTTLGYTGADYILKRHVLQNMDIRGLRACVELPSFIASGSELIVSDSTLDCTSENITSPPLWTSKSHARNVPARKVTLNNLLYPGENGATWDIDHDLFLNGGQTNRNYAVLDEVFVYDHDGNVATDFRLFRPQQEGSDDMPDSVPLNSVGSESVVGCPDSGLTNDQCFTTHGRRTGGENTTCTDTTAGVRGFTCAVTQATPTPTHTPTPAPTATATPTPTQTPITAPARHRGKGRMSGGARSR